MKKHKKYPTVRALRWGFTISMFVIIAVTLTLSSAFELLLARTEILGGFNPSEQFLRVLFSALFSLPIGALLTTIFINFLLKPIQRLLMGMKRLANGHFEDRLDPGDFRPMKEMAHTFNALASELQDTQMLRSDFVNSFSHEFKTPIVSIRGFARLLQRENLSEEKRQEYLNIIVEESTRLSNMATNVLNLSKVEKQSILADVSCFNLSEQVRKCVLLLEKKWAPKGLEITAEFYEYQIIAEAELLEQVWLNLLDNAIKFSPEEGEIAVNVVKKGDELKVSIVNHGPQILPEQIARIYDKFWQGDDSHFMEGNGIGLSVTKRIVELHKGSIEVTSSPEATTFTVTLPCESRVS